MNPLEWVSVPPAPKPVATARTWKEKVEFAVEALRNLEQREMPVTHIFEDGKYIREIFMPADTYVIGHIHKTEHWNEIVSGRARVTMEGKTQELAAPHKFISGAGVQKVLYIIEDMRWRTFHDNPTNSQDIPALEAGIVELDAKTLAEKGALQLDELRMLNTRKGLAMKQPIILKRGIVPMRLTYFSVAIIGVAGTVAAAGVGAYSQHQASKAADARMNAQLDASGKTLGTKPKVAEYVPIDFEAEQLNAIMGNFRNLEGIQDFMSHTNATIDRDTLQRAMRMVPGYKNMMRLQGNAATSLLGGQLPFDDVLDITADRSGLTGALGTPGTAAPATLRDLGLSRLDAIKSGAGLMSGMVNIAEMINPVGRRMRPQDMFMSPSERIRMAMEQNQIIQQSTQSKYNIEAGADPVAAAQAQLNFARQSGAMGTGGQGVDWSGAISTVVPQLAGLFNQQGGGSYAAAVPRLAGDDIGKFNYTTGAGWRPNTTSIPA